MAALLDADRFTVQQDFCTDLSRARSIFTLTRPELRAAINAIDDWIVANQASFNLAIPQPARGVLTADQKTELFMRVMTKRFLTKA